MQGMAIDNNPASPVLSMRFCLVTGPAHLRFSSLANQRSGRNIIPTGWLGVRDGRWMALKGGRKPASQSTLPCSGSLGFTPYLGRLARNAPELLPWRQGQSFSQEEMGLGKLPFQRIAPSPFSLPAGRDPAPSLYCQPG